MLLLAQTAESLPEILWEAATPTAVFWYVYFLAGIGFFGGYQYWGFFGRALYWLVFPIHTAVILVVLLSLDYMRLAGANPRYVSTPFIFLVVVAMSSLIGPVGFVLGVIGGSIIAYRHWKTGKW